MLDSGLLTDGEKEFFRAVRMDMPEVTATIAVHKMSEYLFRYYNEKVIILLDEYDTPMQEAYVNGYWEEIVSFIRNMFNAVFKTNPYLERAVLTVITRVSKETVFSGLNNLEVVTTTSNKYACSFGFTEEEVFCALDELGLSDKKQEVKIWYDVMLEPRTKEYDGIVMEFKVHDPEEEAGLLETAEAALAQIEEKIMLLPGLGRIFQRDVYGIMGCF